MKNEFTSTIFFVHRGPARAYLQAAILQARSSSASSLIVLLSDQPENSLPQELVQTVFLGPIADYSATAKEFERTFRADGPNSYEYELMNFQRWFMVNSFCEHHSINGPLVMLDSDSFLFLSVETVLPSLTTGMSVVDKVGPQFTFFSNSSHLRDFIRFLSESFRKKALYTELQTFVRNSNIFGLPNVGDMAALGLYAQKNSLVDFGRADRLDFVFCENIGSSQGLVMNTLGKRVSWRRGRRYFTTRDGRHLLAGGVHLQGGNKVLWPFFVDTTVRRKMRKLSPLDYRIARREALEKAVRIGLLRSAARLRKLVSRNRAR